jgi:hypothetical protein
VAAALAAVHATPPPPVPPKPPGPVPPSPPRPAPPPAGQTPSAAPAKLKVRRAGVRGGRLDVLALITRHARGSVKIGYRASGRTHRFDAPISDGRIRFAQRLPRALRSGDGGILSLAWAGDAAVRGESVRLRAAAQPAGLRRGAIELRDRRLRVAGRISARAEGVVRLRLSYGVAGEFSFTARIRRGRWSAAVTVPPEARSGGYLSIQYTGYRGARGGPMRGEQDALQVSAR